MKGIVWPFVDMTKFLGVLVQGTVAGLLGLAAYVLLCWLLKSEELGSFIASAKSRLLRLMAKDRPTEVEEP
ncbi:MAG TPA: hypothetical protein VMD74_02665, partial [Candidatus Methylomirabilis sp.]|nr:hypothetical protein [Candidatus Methylomirabilis sp.]